MKYVDSESRRQSVIEVCQTEQVAVPGSYLDRLLKTSQSITYDFLNLIHDRNATVGGD
ncbi:MAG TPA: hypothetical protein VHZ55_23950 [Bryobacteraceae bacterium]|jgi:hypothetical protein|nr:hypothetical protein [Bryobacteraceae bacterium]